MLENRKMEVKVLSGIRLGNGRYDKDGRWGVHEDHQWTLVSCKETNEIMNYLRKRK